MKICVIGTGYVGLVVGACLADMGNVVICVDNDEKKLDSLKNGDIPIYEPGLEELVKTNYQKGFLIFTSDIDNAVKVSEVCFIAVGTPQNDDGSADLTYVMQAAKSIAKAMNGYKVIVDKSTVPVGTASRIKELVKSITDCEFDVVSNPEFLKQGSAVDDFLYPDRVIIGSDSERASQIMKDIYSTFLRTSNKLIFMDVKSAEMTKYAANCFLATKISFMNEISNLCEIVGANIENVRLGISSDSRIGNKFLFSGLGYGGSCFPKDVNALIKTGAENNVNMSIIEAVNETNKQQRVNFVNKILQHFGKDLSDKTFAVWGLAFKPKTNDMREAPSITIINKLLEHGAKIQAYDPKAMDTAKNIFGDKIIYTRSSYDALRNADCLLLLTEWNEFRLPDFQRIKTTLKTPVIFDGRNQYNEDVLTKMGFIYYCFGKQ